MNLLLTSTAYPPSVGGAQLYVHQLATHLLAMHSVQVVSFWDRNRTDWLLGTTLNAPEQEGDYQVDGVPVHTLAFLKEEKRSLFPSVALYYPFMRLAAAQIATLIEKKLHLYASQANLIHNIRIGREPLSLASYNLAKKHSIPFFLSPLHHPRWTGWRYQVYQRLYQQADGLIALTEAEKSALIKLGAKPERIFVTGMGPILSQSGDGVAFRNRHSIQGPMVLFLGQHYIYKGFQPLLHSAQLVWQKEPEVHFVFVGPVVKDSEKHFENVDARIHRLGAINLQEKTDALAACTLLCVPSTQESFGGIYTEAWSLKKPVIGCPIPAVKEVITDGIDGYLVEQKKEDIAEKIIDLVKNPEKAARMGEAGYSKVQRRYTWNRLAELTEEAYRNILNGS